MSSNRATLKKVADALGLSVNTVSRALAGKDAVKESTRQLIEKTAAEMGYVPNSMARSLVLGKAMTIGLVITNPSNPFYARLISAVEERCRSHGYSLLLFATEENPDNERSAVQTLYRWGVDGAIVVPSQQTAEPWELLRKYGIPMVLINRFLEGFNWDFVGVDHEQGAYEATRALLHTDSQRRVCLLEEDLEISTVRSRTNGYARAMTEAGHGEEHQLVERVPTNRQDSSTLPWDPAAAYQAARALLQHFTPGSAVLVGNDHFALGLYKALAEAGLRVPEDIEVFGYGNHPFSAYMQPPLSTMALPAESIGASAVNLLIQRIDGTASSDEPAHIVKPAQMMLRESTRVRQDAFVPAGTSE
ncbi:LacI family DNA-binding transcriptional regulator [Arthrobacter sp. NPDC055585]